MKTGRNWVEVFSFVMGIASYPVVQVGSDPVTHIFFTLNL